VLDLKKVTDQTDDVQSRLSLRGEIPAVEQVIALSGRRKLLIREVEGLRRDQKTASLAMKEKLTTDSAAATALREQLRAASGREKALGTELKSVEAELAELLLVIPNIPHESTPKGSSSDDNLIIRSVGSPARFDFEPQAHWDIGERLGILDFARGAKLSGARFTVLIGRGARLERALINFMLDLHTHEHGYTEVQTPYLVLRDTMQGTGQLPKFEGDSFKTVEPEYFLIPTAEVPVTNLHRDEILDAAELPKKYACYSACFRREAGAAGRDTRGLIRQHQFDKVELVKFSRPEDSYTELESLTKNAETILQKLGLAYRVVQLCGGDLGFSAAKTYDLEVWMPGQNAYREISSCSNFEDFQARRARIRFRRAQGEKPEFVHTLNGSGLAVGRTLAAILEVGQRADGSVVVPEALVPYTTFREIREAQSLSP
jgi:seryl-tRNA synthetase